MVGMGEFESPFQGPKPRIMDQLDYIPMNWSESQKSNLPQEGLQPSAIPVSMTRLVAPRGFAPLLSGSEPEMMDCYITELMVRSGRIERPTQAWKAHGIPLPQLRIGGGAGCANRTRMYSLAMSQVTIDLNPAWCPNRDLNSG